MAVKEQEIRTKCLRLLMCKVKLEDDGQLVLETKNGKRTECLGLNEFIEYINNFTENNVPQLYIESR